MRRLPFVLGFGLGLAALASACGGDDTKDSFPIEAHCNPLGAGA